MSLPPLLVIIAYLFYLNEGKIGGPTLQFQARNRKHVLEELSRTYPQKQSQ